MAIAGKVAITPGGEWSDIIAYDKLVVVTFGNNVYLSIKPSTGIEPTNEEYWMLLIENVTQEQYESILNGTIAVGNALKLNGLTDKAFVQRLPDQHGGDTVISASLTEFINAQVANGILSGEFSFFNILYTERPSGANAYGIVRFMKHLDGYTTVWFKAENQYVEYIGIYVHGTNNISLWTKSSDGGNADTVDGLQGSAIVATKANFNSTDLSHANIPAESGVWSTPSTGLTGLPTGWGDARHNLTRLYNGNASYSLDFLASYTQMLAWRMGKEWREILDSSNYKKFALPLDGSVPMSGTNLLIGSGYGRWHSDNNSCTIGALNAPNNTNNMRSVDIFSPSFRTDIAKALQFRDTVNGAYKYYDIHHDGNSAKVVTSASAPSDTSAVWIDSANKVSKIYIDGAWTALA